MIEEEETFGLFEESTYVKFKNRFYTKKEILF